MAGKYRDRTSERAISYIDREWHHMAKLAVMLREKNNDPVWAEKQEAKFTGIFRRLLTDPIEEVQKEAGR